MIDQSTALWIFSVSALIYIVWIDARPTVRSFLRRKKVPFKLLGDGKAMVLSSSIANNDGSIGDYRYQFQIRLRNISDAKLTNVRMKLWYGPYEHVVRIGGNLSQKDVAPDEDAVFDFAELRRVNPIEDFGLKMTFSDEFPQARLIPSHEGCGILWLVPLTQRPVGILLKGETGRLMDCHACVYCDEHPSFGLQITADYDEKTDVKFHIFESETPARV